MAAWTNTSPELSTRFAAALPAAADVEQRKMFGCPCAFVNGNMFAGMAEERLIVRVPEAAAAHPCVLKGRTMKEYAAFTDATNLAPAAMARWIARGYDFARALPPKAIKPAKPKPATAATKAAAKARRAAPMR